VNKPDKDIFDPKSFLAKVGLCTSVRTRYKHQNQKSPSMPLFDLFQALKIDQW
jgi:hypothetical protein